MSATALPSPKESILPPFFVFSILLVLLLIPEVVWRKPIVTTEERGEWVSHHQEAANAILARRIVRDHLPAQPTRWLRDTFSFEIGNGIWYSSGAVGLASPDGLEVSTPYEIMFTPNTSRPLYLSIGSQSEGDRTDVIRRAHLKAGQP